MKEATEGAGAGVVRDAEFWAKAERHLIRYARGDFAPVIIERAAGSYVYDSDGRAILDFTSGQMSALLGHSHPAVVEAVSTSIAHAGPPVQRDAEPAGRRPRHRARRDAAESLSKTMLLSTGGESNEAAIRMAKLVTGRHEIVAFDAAYHGVTHAAAAATFAISRAGYGPVAPGNIPIPTPDSYRPGLVDRDRHDWRAELDSGLRDGRSACRSAAWPRSSPNPSCPPAASSCRRPATSPPWREVPRAGDAADLRRGADRPGPDRRLVRLRARRRRPRHPHPVQDPGRRAAAVGGDHQRTRSRPPPTSAASTSSPPTSPIRWPRRSAWRSCRNSTGWTARPPPAASASGSAPGWPDCSTSRADRRRSRPGPAAGHRIRRGSGRQGAGGRVRHSGDSRLSRRRPASQHRPVPGQQQHPADRAAADDLRCRAGRRPGHPRFRADQGGLRAPDPRRTRLGPWVPGPR